MNKVETYERLHAQITDRGPWMQTYTGKAFYLANPRPEEVDIVDIAHSLANTCRYSGHTLKHYSVAQHAILVSRWMEEDGHPPSWCFAGLHHDSVETYVGDNTSQVKQLVPEIRVLETEVEDVVDIFLEIERTPTMKAVIKEYDFVALATEERDILGPNISGLSWGELPDPHPYIIIPLVAERAEKLFLANHYRLLKEIGNASAEAPQQRDLDGGAYERVHQERTTNGLDEVATS